MRDCWLSWVPLSWSLNGAHGQATEFGTEMGFFSQNCEGCGHPMLSWYVVNEINTWMMHGVAIEPDGSILKGHYDGYGRLDEHEYAIGDTNTIWHEACWQVAGCPTDYRGASKHAQDQGFFYNDPEHDMAEPEISAQ